MKIETLKTPETITNGGLSIAITHQASVVIIDPRNGVEKRTMRGYLDASGNFQDHGPHIVEALNKTELAQVIADTSSGTAAGDFRLSDLDAKIATRKAAEEAVAKAKAEAVAKAEAEIVPE